MPSDPPFLDSTDRSLDTDQLLYEAVPVAKLVALVTLVAFVPFALQFGVGGNEFLGVLFGVLGQFVLAVGAAVVLLYVVARARQLA
ncbi:hypothetical protein [Haloglomus salinum]|jgi:uncharacterized membrane protein|uniref:hypothetical protein n=1 Tax=Haloglomus salinum TaxID=2962673 RepID=UPI0020C9E5C8|nr:hypothetical protein [Haloglomus salinum]